jgi:hypothetical protein
MGVRRLLLRRLTYANVMSTLAVFIALGGASYAVASLPAHSVGRRQLKAGAVTTANLAFPLGALAVTEPHVIGLVRNVCDSPEPGPGVLHIDCEIDRVGGIKRPVAFPLRSPGTVIISVLTTISNEGSSASGVRVMVTAVIDGSPYETRETIVAAGQSVVFPSEFLDHLSEGPHTVDITLEPVYVALGTSEAQVSMLSLVVTTAPRL